MAISGCLVIINDRPVNAMRSKDPRGEGFARRDQNITWQADLGNDNTLVEGRWWTEADRGRALVSTLIALPMFVVLIGLGVWQVERLQRKLEMIAERDAGFTFTRMAPARAHAM